jgi:hypothetical protein
MNSSTCLNCIWLRQLPNPRPDEPSDLGCAKPGWEGYTTLAKPACGGTLFIPKEN